MYHANSTQPIEMERLTFQTNQSSENNTTAITIFGYAASAKSNSFNLAPVNLNLFVKEIDTKALTEFVHAALTTHQLNQLSISFIQLISQGIFASLDSLTFGTEHGPVTVRGMLHLSKTSSNLTSIVTNAEGNAQINMPLPWLKKVLSQIYQDKKIEIDDEELTPEQIADQQIEYWLTNKQLIQEGQDIQLKIIYNKGRLLINDLPSASKNP